MNKIFATAALCAVLSAPAMAQSSLIGDKDCFGLGGSCAEGTLWRDDLGGTFFTNYQGAGDPSFTDKWDADANITYFHDYTLGAASSAALTISTELVPIRSTRPEVIAAPAKPPRLEPAPMNPKMRRACRGS